MNHIAHVDEQADLHDAGQAEQRCLAVRRIREVWPVWASTMKFPLSVTSGASPSMRSSAVHPRTSMIAHGGAVTKARDLDGEGEGAERLDHLPVVRHDDHGP